MYVIPNITAQLEGSDKVQLDIFDDNTIRFLLSKDFENSSEWKFIKKINMKNSFITSLALEMLAGHSNLEKVQEIDLSKNYSTINDNSLQILLKSKYSKNLAKINLSDTDITDATITNLSESDCATNMKELIFYGNYLITDVSLITISNSSLMSNLVSLDLRSTCITDEGIEQLCKSKNSRNLRMLDLSMNGKQITDRTVMAITLSQNVKQLKCLRLASSYVTDRSLITFLESINSQFIRELDLSNEKDTVERRKFMTRITDNFLVQLAKSAHLTRIKRLNLRATEITSYGLHQLCISFNADFLAVLRISWNMGIDDQALISIQQNYEEKVRRLQKLYINDTSVTQEGIVNLLKKIPYLDLIYNVEISNESQMKQSKVTAGKKGGIFDSRLSFQNSQFSKK